VLVEQHQVRQAPTPFDLELPETVHFLYFQPTQDERPLDPLMLLVEELMPIP